MSVPLQRNYLESLYRRFNRRCHVHPDPVEFLYAFADVREREVAGLLVSSLAYGRVRHIHRSITELLGRTGPPRAFLERSTPAALRRAMAGFKHRFANEDAMGDFLLGLRRVLRHHGSLAACFLAGLDASAETVLPALEHFVSELRAGMNPDRSNHLLPHPAEGSACKRLHLYLRWMVRRDAVDPGGWDGVAPARLLMPVDTHIHRFALRHGLTRRKQADLRTVHEITAAFRHFAPRDPVRYDFSITRLGILGVSDDGASKAPVGYPEGGVS